MQHVLITPRWAIYTALLQGQEEFKLVSGGQRSSRAARPLQNSSLRMCTAGACGERRQGRVQRLDPQHPQTVQVGCAVQHPHLWPDANSETESARPIHIHAHNPRDAETEKRQSQKNPEQHEGSAPHKYSTIKALQATRRSQC